MNFEIKYLVFAGGGGKGSAYLPVLELLEESKNQIDENLLSKVEGFAGTSVGAIIAFALACGHSPKDIRKRIEVDDLFADLVAPQTIAKAVSKYALQVDIDDK